MSEKRLKQIPIDSKLFPEIAAGLRGLGWMITEIGIMDDMAPDHSPNTACMRAVERNAANGLVVNVETPIDRHSVHVTRYMLYPPVENSK